MATEPRSSRDEVARRGDEIHEPEVPPPDQAAPPSQKPPADRSSTLWIWLGTVLALVILAFHLLSNWYQQAVEKAVAPALPQAVGSSEGLAAFAWADEGEVPADGRLRLWIMFENRTGAPVKKLRFLVFHTPGFDKIKPCWVNNAPACRPTPGVPPTLGLPANLENNGAATVYAELVPKTWYGRHGASGVFSWQDEKGQSWERSVVLPAVQISSRRGLALSSLGKFLDLLKDLALPVVLAYLGWYLQRQEKQREEKREEREKDEQDKKESREKEQTRLRETWNLMLPKSHANAEKHYMPVTASIRGVEDALDRLKKEDSPREHHRLLYELLLFLRKMKFLAEDIGGFYFRDRQGEVVVAACWRLFLYRAQAALDAEDSARAMAGLTPQENLSQFLEKLPRGETPAGGETPRDQSYRPSDVLEGIVSRLEKWTEGRDEPSQKLADALGRISEKLKTWLQGGRFEEDLVLLRLFGTILEYEMNRPYDPWYGEPTQFPQERFASAVQQLNPADPSLTDLRNELDAYARRINSVPAA